MRHIKTYNESIDFDDWEDEEIQEDSKKGRFDELERRIIQLSNGLGREIGVYLSHKELKRFNELIEKYNYNKAMFVPYDNINVYYYISNKYDRLVAYNHDTDEARRYNTQREIIITDLTKD